MDSRAELRAVVAEFLEIGPETVSAEMELGGPRLASSLARAGLDAALRSRLGIKSRAAYTARAYGELEAAVLGDADTASPEIPATPFPTVAEPSVLNKERSRERFSCGVDIENVDNFPEALDYWEHDFYRLRFSKAEIAYCVSQLNPREHFAARWAAKEALKKSSASYMALDATQIEITIADSGAPGIMCNGAELDVAVSLSHTATMAVALIVIPSASQSTAIDDAGAPAVGVGVDDASPTDVTRKKYSFRRVTLWMVQLLGLVLAAWALARTFQISL